MNCLKTFSDRDFAATVAEGCLKALVKGGSECELKEIDTTVVFRC